MSDPWRQRRTPLIAVFWAVVPSTLALALAPRIADAELRGVIYTGAGALLFGGFLGGMLKVLLDDVVAAKRRREDAAQFVTNVLADLKSAYDHVGRARITIPAYRSVKVYGVEMRGLIDCRIQLRNVTRALERRADGVSEGTRTPVTAHVTRMADYVEGLTLEFRDHFRRVASLDEPWQAISNLPALSDFISHGSKYKTTFESPLDDASGLLRGELARILK